MAKEIIVNEYFFEGELTALESLEASIAKAKELCLIDKNKGFMKALFSELGLAQGYKKLLLNGYGIDWEADWEMDGIFTYEHGGLKGYMMKITEMSDRTEVSNLNYILRQIKDLCPSSLDFRSCGDYIDCQTNNRSLFPEMYYVNCPNLVDKGIDTKYFNDDDAVLTAFKKVFDLPESVSHISDLAEWCKNSDIEYVINEIETVCSIANPKYNYGLDTRKMAIDAHTEDIDEAVESLYKQIHNEVTCCINIGRGFFASKRLKYQGPVILFKEPIDKKILSKYILDFGCSKVKDIYFLGYNNNTSSGSVSVNNKDAKDFYAEYLLTHDIDTLRKSAELGYTLAMKKLHDTMQFDDEMEEEALNWLNKAAELGIPEAQYSLARKYLDNNFLDIEDVDTVYMLLSRSAESGYRKALEYLASSKVSKLELTDDQETYWVEKAATIGIESAVERLAKLCYISKDYSRALELYKKVELNHNLNGSKRYTDDNLAIMYYEGLGCDIDYMKAACYFSEDAAEFQLALEENNENVDPKKWKAIAWESYRRILEVELNRALNFNNNWNLATKLYEKLGYCEEDDCNQMAWAYCETENFEAALPLARNAVEKDPQAPVYDTLATALEGVGQYKEALSAFEKCLSLYKKEDNNIGITKTERKISILKQKM